jgi:transcriptional regulator with XRE-family HTH domain
MGRKLRKPRPSQGARLLALRNAAGLSQAELARLVGETQANISFWERTDKPPRSDVLPKLAKVLGVSLEALLGDHSAPQKLPSLASAPGPAGQVQRAFEEVRRLPRRQQQKIIDVVLAFVNDYKRKAS